MLCCLLFFYVIIDLFVIVVNFVVVRKCVGDWKVFFVVKVDVYGYGVVEVLCYVEKYWYVDWFVVVMVVEG